MNAVLEVIAPGVGASIQDLGRPGWRRFGVPVGGVMDPDSARNANALLENQPDAPVLEILLQGAKFKVLVDTWLALAGADLGCVIPVWTASKIPAGTILEFPQAREGLWTYLAVPGGFDVTRFLGSASVDARNGLGEPLKPGDQLGAVQHPSLRFPGLARRLSSPHQGREPSTPAPFWLLKGPQFSDTPGATLEALVSASWKVSSRSDRSGFRLEGPLLQVPDAIQSEPVLPGSMQIPGNGQPIVTMNDGPTVGGYPKPALLREADLGRFAQSPPGTRLAFRWMPLLNCDLGENEADQQTKKIMAQIDAANICCGVHAGHQSKTRTTLEMAKKYGVLVGAHPGLSDQSGRGSASPSEKEFSTLLSSQVGDFLELAAEVKVPVQYLKLHGALYHAVEKDEALARIFLNFLEKLPVALGVFSLAGGRVAALARKRKFKVWEEIFADRGYTHGGTLIPRGLPGSLLKDPKAAGRRIQQWLDSGKIPDEGGSLIALQADTVCVHSDSPGALKLLEILQPLRL